MTMTTHIAAGAFIAAVFKNPLLAIPVAYASHFVLDALPHYDAPEAENVIKRNENRITNVKIIIDSLLSIALLIFIFYFYTDISKTLLAACVLAATAPDLVWIYRFIGEIRTHREKPKNFISQFHVDIQKLDRPWLPLLVVEAGLDIVLIWLSINLTR